MDRDASFEMLVLGLEAQAFMKRVVVIERRRERLTSRRTAAGFFKCGYACPQIIEFRLVDIDAHFAQLPKQVSSGVLNRKTCRLGFNTSARLDESDIVAGLFVHPKSRLRTRSFRPEVLFLLVTCQIF